MILVVKDEPGLACFAGAFDTKARQRLANPLAPEVIIDGKQPDTRRVRDRVGWAAGSVLGHVGLIKSMLPNSSPASPVATKTVSAGRAARAGTSASMA